jgi:hypothetical protein
MIATKIQNNDYCSLSELEKDLLLMTKNACLFNEPGSQIYKNAKALKKVIVIHVSCCINNSNFCRLYKIKKMNWNM